VGILTKYFKYISKKIENIEKKLYKNKIFVKIIQNLHSLNCFHYLLSSQSTWCLEDNNFETMEELKLKYLKRFLSRTQISERICFQNERSRIRNPTLLCRPIKYNSDDGQVTDVVCHVVVWYSMNIMSVMVLTDVLGVDFFRKYTNWIGFYP